MNGTLNHVWGESRAADRIWAQFAGMAPSKRRRRLIMTLQAFIDESSKPGGNTFVLGGCIANVETWAKFSKEWEQLLGRFGRLDEKGRRYFHMTEMPDAETIEIFYRCIERHIPIFISCRFDRSVVQRAQNRIFVAGGGINWSSFNNLYFIAFRILMDAFHGDRKDVAEFIPLEEKVYFIFDENSNKSHVRRAWDDYMSKRRPEVRERFANEPRFEDDKEFEALQAADLWAWWVRYWADSGQPQNITEHDFGHFRRRPGRRRLTIDLAPTEDTFVKFFDGAAKCYASHYDVTVLPSLDGR